MVGFIFDSGTLLGVTYLFPKLFAILVQIMQIDHLLLIRHQSTECINQIFVDNHSHLVP